ATRARERDARAQDLRREPPRVHRLRRGELPGGGAAPGLGAAGLPARGGPPRPGPRHGHAPRHRPRPPRHPARDTPGERRPLGARAARALDEEHELLARAVLGEHADRGAAAGAHALDAVDRLLDLLRRVAAPAQHDRVLRAAEEVELALEDEADVAAVEPAVAERRG